MSCAGKSVLSFGVLSLALFVGDYGRKEMLVFFKIGLGQKWSLFYSFTNICSIGLPLWLTLRKSFGTQSSVRICNCVVCFFFLIFSFTVSVISHFFFFRFPFSIKFILLSLPLKKKKEASLHDFIPTYLYSLYGGWGVR